MPSSNEIIKKARSFIGLAYSYGGSSPSTGFDCSGFLFYIFNQFGINIGRTTYSQIAKGKKINTKSDLLPGDLIFYLDENKSPYHVVMYTGNDMIIESPRTGLSIREIKMNIWSGEARRILPEITTTITPVTPPISPKLYYRVVCGSFATKDFANVRKDLLNKLGYDSFLLAYPNVANTSFRVICGSFSDKTLATTRISELKLKGFDSFILTS